MIPILIIAGFLIGMLINYLADVLVANRRLSRPVCLACRSNRSWKNFFTFQPCENCGKAVSLRTKLVPLIFIGLTVYLFFFPGPRLGFLPLLFLLAYFAVVFIHDLEYKVVLYQVSIAGLVICAIYGFYLHDLLPTLLGGAVGFAIMYLLYLGGGWFIRIISKRRGEEIDGPALGFGDVAIGAVIGLLLGWPAITAGLMIGIVIGGLISGIFLIASFIRKKYQPLAALPYTPFLILGAIILLFWKG